MNIEESLKPGIADHIYNVVNGALGFYPGGQALFSFMVKDPLMQRRDEWLMNFEKRISALESKGVDIEDLKKNGAFIDAVITAANDAICTCDKQKNQMLLNAICNMAEGKIPSITNDAAKTGLFFRLIREFPVANFEILFYFDDPIKRLKEKKIDPNKWHMGSALKPFEEYFECKVDNEPLIKIAIDDMNRYQLLTCKTDSLYGVMSQNGMLASRITGLGKELLSFIKSDD